MHQWKIKILLQIVLEARLFCQSFVAFLLFVAVIIVDMLDCCGFLIYVGYSLHVVDTSLVSVT